MLVAQKHHPLAIVRPPADQFRVAALHRYNVLDTPSCADFDFLTELAAKLCGMPYAFISLVDADRVWVKSSAGMTLDTLPRGDSYCSLAVMGDAVTTIADLAADYRTAGMHLGVSAPYMRSYSSVALTTPDGFAIGTLSVMGTQPGSLAPEQWQTLTGLGRQA